MTRKLLPEERKGARPPLSKKALTFISRGLARGHSQKAVLASYNDAVTQSAAQLRSESALWEKRLSHPQTWESLSGERPAIRADVTRVYDDMRKTDRFTGQYSSRKNLIRTMHEEDIQRRLINEENKKYGMPYRTIPSTQIRSDLAYRRHFGASRAELEEFAAELGLSVDDIPKYLLGE